jgi:hypothetical protein
MYKSEEEESEEQYGGKRELKLINSGAFGCIFRPNLTCDGKIGTAKYVTKIQKNKRTIAHELRISERVKKIRGYARFFAPVLKYCQVRIKKDHIKDLNKCEIFENETAKQIESASYVSMKTRYVGDNDLRKYIFSNKTPKLFLKEILQTHLYLLKGIQKLFANKIVHYDLKYNNIIFDSGLKVPVIIDFGQSWCTDELKTENEISAAFFVFEQYDYWCIDILICNYIIQKVGFKEAKTDFVTEQEIDQIYDVFIYGREPKYESSEEGAKKKILSDVYRYNILQNPNKMLSFKSKLDEYLQPFINKRTWWELYEELIGYANTWDCYSLSVIYLNMLDDAYLSNVELYNIMLKSTDIRLDKYVELMETVVYSSPNNRPTIQNVLTNVESIINNKK